jgi:hypothetical protein
MNREVKTWRRLPRFVAALAAAVVVATTAGCNLPTACTSELGMIVQPGQQTLVVGQSFRAEAIGTSCGGRQRWTQPVFWETPDTAVVSVERETGRITGRAVGSAVVTAYERNDRNGPRWGEVRVTVVP